MEQYFPVSYSSIEKNALLALIAKEYEIGNPQTIYFWKRSLNDTYFLDTEKGRWVARVYRIWRKAHDVEFELKWLIHLAQERAAVLAPLCTKNGKLFLSIDAPEGERQIAVFPFVKNAHVPPVTTSVGAVFGKALAQLHAQSDSFTLDNGHFLLDEKHLVAKPLQSIERLWGHNAEEYVVLKVAAPSIAATIGNYKKGPQIYGPCHGDVHFENLLFNDRQHQWIDFDCGGMGARIYDIACFYWALKIKWPGWEVEYKDPDEEIWEAFVTEYESVRRLEDDEKKSFRDFVLARHIWALGLQASNADDWTYSWMTDVYFAQQVAFFKELGNKASIL